MLKKLCYILITILFSVTCHGLENCSLECDRREKSLSYLDTVLEMITKVKENFPMAAGNNAHYYPLDCEDLKLLGHDESGIYTIWPKNRLIEGKSMNVYCDMKTDGGGWTLIQRRGDFGFVRDYFYREWSSYKNGFGEMDKEFWLGNDKIFALTNQNLYSVRFDLTSVDGEKRYALYDRFWIDDETNDYTLHIMEYSGNAGDSMIDEHNNRQFSTKDRGGNSCAKTYQGGWWYGNCHHSNLNGLNHQGKHTSYADGINWKEFRFHNESLGFTEIKIRPIRREDPQVVNSQMKLWNQIMQMKPMLQDKEQNNLKPEIHKTPKD